MRLLFWKKLVIRILKAAEACAFLWKTHVTINFSCSFDKKYYERPEMTTCVAIECAQCTPALQVQALAIVDVNTAKSRVLPIMCAVGHRYKDLAHRSILREEAHPNEEEISYPSAVASYHPPDAYAWDSSPALPWYFCTRL
jgi:hypothetical protein